MPIFEAWSTIATLAAMTEHVEIGTLVTPIGLRNPAYLGKMIANIYNIAGGRIIPGLGGGWVERKFTDFNKPKLPHKIDVLRAHCDTIGRDPASITISQRSLVTIAPDETALAPMV